MQFWNRYFSHIHGKQEDGQARGIYVMMKSYYHDNVERMEQT